jgi:hypothetical protein
LGNDDNLGIGNIRKASIGMFLKLIKPEIAKIATQIKVNALFFNEKAIIFLMNLFMIDKLVT